MAVSVNKIATKILILVTICVEICRSILTQKTSTYRSSVHGHCIPSAHASTVMHDGIGTWSIFHYSMISGFLPVNARLPVNAHLIFLCWRSNASISIQNGRSLHAWYFQFAVKTADNGDKL